MSSEIVTVTPTGTRHGALGHRAQGTGQRHGRSQKAIDSGGMKRASSSMF